MTSKFSVLSARRVTGSTEVFDVKSAELVLMASTLSTRAKAIPTPLALLVIPVVVALVKSAIPSL
jgi:hypothetical protein